MAALSQCRPERKAPLKAIISLSLILAIFAVIFPLVTALGAPIFSEPMLSDTSENIGSGDLYYSSDSDASSDASRLITLLDSGTTMEMTMSEYLRGAVAAEMPASFDSEALKAQAVAIRTYAVRLLDAPSSAHPDASVCSDSSCCMAWKPDSYLREKWGGDYEEYISKITAAVEATDGQYLTFNGEPALAAFHSSSMGKTENSGDVWSSDLPYLVSVDSPETAEDVPNFESSVTVSAADFSAAISAAHPEADLSGDPVSWIGQIARTSSGRIAAVSIGGVDIEGTELRSIFSLRSTAASISAADNAITMTSKGYGHGVGMSQYGANIMAESGDTYEDILAWYYPGTVLATP